MFVECSSPSMESRPLKKRLHTADKKLFILGYFIGDADTLYVPLKVLLIGAAPGFRFIINPHFHDWRLKTAKGHK